MENKIIPTAKELIETDYYHLHLDTDSICLGSIETAMIEFAKLHVEAALKEAMYKADTKELSSMEVHDHYREEILNSYPLENIK